jgi:hypothetical protein
LCVSATHSAVNGALLIEKETTHKDNIVKQQFPVYCILKVLAGSKKYYSRMEKICYAVIISAQKLRHYFEAQAVKVLTNQPLGDIFGNRDSSGTISKWGNGTIKTCHQF